MYLETFLFYATLKLLKMDNQPMIKEFFGDHISKCPIMIGKKAPGTSYDAFQPEQEANTLSSFIFEFVFIFEVVFTFEVIFLLDKLVKPYQVIQLG